MLSKNLEDTSFCIQDSAELSNNIELDEFEKLFFDNLNNDYEEDDEFLASNTVFDHQTSSFRTLKAQDLNH